MRMRKIEIDGTEYYCVNYADWKENFWKHKYLINIDGICFTANQGCEQDAIDEIIDWCERRLPNFLLSDKEVEEKTETEREECICGGNHGRYIKADYLDIKEVE